MNNQSRTVSYHSLRFVSSHFPLRPCLPPSFRAFSLVPFLSPFCPIIVSPHSLCFLFCLAPIPFALSSHYSLAPFSLPPFHFASIFLRSLLLLIISPHSLSLFIVLPPFRQPILALLASFRFFLAYSLYRRIFHHVSLQFAQGFAQVSKTLRA